MLVNYQRQFSCPYDTSIVSYDRISLRLAAGVSLSLSLSLSLFRYQREVSIWVFRFSFSVRTLAEATMIYCKRLSTQPRTLWWQQLTTSGPWQGNFTIQELLYLPMWTTNLSIDKRGPLPAFLHFQYRWQ